MKRAFVIVIDACGAGELPDAADYGDAGTNTLGHVAEAAGGLELPVLQGLGLGDIMPLVGVAPSPERVVHGRLHPLGPGKDTITGHWELMGVVTPVPLRTYPEGFPEDVIEQLIDASGRGVLCNRPYSGTAVIDDFGEQHLATGNLIVYTSADSVLQIAAHIDVVPPAELYSICAAAREIMSGEHAVGRVIARPFRGAPGAFVAHRRAQGPRAAPARALVHGRAAGRGRAGPHRRQDRPGLRRRRGRRPAQGRDERRGAGGDGRADRHARRRASSSPTSSRPTRCSAIAATSRASMTRCKGIDAEVGRWLERLDPARDLLVITADHGCDPTTPGTDHTREHAPLLARFDGHGGRRHDGPFADVGASVLRWLTGSEAALPGSPFL